MRCATRPSVTPQRRTPRSSSPAGCEDGGTRERPAELRRPLLAGLNRVDRRRRAVETRAFHVIERHLECERLDLVIETKTERRRRTRARASRPRRAAVADQARPALNGPGHVAGPAWRSPRGALRKRGRRGCTNRRRAARSSRSRAARCASRSPRQGPQASMMRSRRRRGPPGRPRHPRTAPSAVQRRDSFSSSSHPVSPSAPCQPFVQHPAATRDPRHHRADRHLQHGRDLGVRELLDVPQPDSLTKRIRQCCPAPPADRRSASPA